MFTSWLPDIYLLIWGITFQRIVGHSFTCFVLDVYVIWDSEALIICGAFSPHWDQLVWIEEQQTLTPLVAVNESDANFKKWFSLLIGRFVVIIVLLFKESPDNRRHH